jgi:hypothetical protein
MAAPYSNIETKCELAAKGHIESIVTRIPGVFIYAGVESLNLEPSEVKYPCVIAHAESAEEHIYGTGQYAVELVIEVISSADDTTAAKHRERVAYIRDEFANDWIGASLSAEVSDFKVVGVILGKATQETDERAWQTNMPMTLHCRPSD